MKVLVADDNRTTIFKLRKNLLEWGYEVLEASDGAQAWETLNQDDPPRIAILDWMMPEIDGVEICRRLNEKQGGNLIYTILLTSKSEKEDLIYALDNGAHDFLSKPVFPGELRSRLAVGRRLVEMNQLKNKFLGIAAHDLRNPIISIRSFAEMMMDEEIGPLSEEEKREFLEMIVEASEEMLLLINDLLDLSAIETGRLDLSYNREKLKPVVIKRLKYFAINAAKKQIKMASELEDVQEASFDKARISQVIDNFLSNALKFSPSGSVVKAVLRQEEGAAVFSVQDQGPGIPPEERDKLFGEFQRLSARPTGGERSTGLGLAIVKKIVESHGGLVQVESQVGQGSVFSFSLPTL